MMSDDIVIRLRTDFECYDHAQEAADEIERLRRDNAALRKSKTTWIICAERLVESLDGNPYKKALDFYADCQRLANEAVRGE